MPRQPEHRKWNAAPSGGQTYQFGLLTAKQKSPDRNIKDTVERSEAAMTEAEKMGMKIIQPLWTMSAYDVVVLLDAPNDETMTAFALKVGSMGSVKTHTMRAFRREEMEGILAKIK
jgi:uncharacterized protein with GYD domain